MKDLVVGITGASGVIYGIRLLEVLQKMEVRTHLVLSEWGEQTIEIETEYSVDHVKGLASVYYSKNNLSAAIASGSFRTNGMVILPCSMKTLSAIAHGYTENLLIRAADVTLKESRRLVLLPRETPFNAIHLENMLKLARLGVIIQPPLPAFYSKPVEISDIVDHTVGRLLDHFHIEHDLVKRWGTSDS